MNRIKLEPQVQDFLPWVERFCCKALDSMIFCQDSYVESHGGYGDRKLKYLAELSEKW